MMGSIAFVILVTVSACGTQDSATYNTISDVDSISVESPTTFSVNRVVSLANGVAEILDSLNAASIVVGRDIASSDSIFPNVPVVTSGHQVLPEPIIALKPDLVIIDESTGPKAALDQLRTAGINIVVVPQIWTVEQIPQKIMAVGAAIGAPAQAQLLVSKIKDSLTSSVITSKPRIAFLYLRGTSSVYLIGGPGSGADSLVAAFSGVDVGAQELPLAFNTLTAETLAALNPEIILVMSKGLQSVGGIEGLVKLPGVAQTIAGKNRAIVDVDDTLLLSFGPRTPSLVNEMAKVFALLAQQIESTQGTNT